MLTNYSIRTFLLISLLSSFSFTVVKSQCNQATIALYSQAAVNGFKHQYGCSVINGTLDIRGEDIVNLDSLIQITQTGQLLIHQTSLTNLDGLNNLKKTTGGIDIEFNNVLTTLSGLNNVDIVQGNLFITDNPLLLSLNGLNGIDSVREQIWVKRNNMLQNLTGLDNLISAQNILLEQNPALFSFEGLGNLTTLRDGFKSTLNQSVTHMGDFGKLKHVGKIFFIIYSPLLQSLEGLKIESIDGGTIAGGEGLYISQTAIKDMKGLEHLDHIDGRLYLYFNENLKTLTGLENLRFVGGHFGIEDNHILNSLDAIADLEYIGGEMEISDNDSLQLCSVPFVCNYLAAPPGLVLIFGNGPGCESPEEIKSNCSPVVEFNLVDANLEIDSDPNTTGDIRQLSYNQLASLNNMRAAVATDGISTVLVRLVTGNTAKLTIDNATALGFEYPWGDTTHFVNGKNYLFCLYTPPDDFDDLEDIFSYGDGIEAYNLAFPYEYSDKDGSRTNHITITHVRPPVVLMHGTYSDPDQTWKTAATGGISMYDRLRNEGFEVFTVNYKQTNGTTGFGTDNTSFAKNAKVLWGNVYPENTGGIKDALTYYRNNLGIAVTQADVVGHSLGGVLPRVYASPQFNPDYKRPDNYMKGDINRLITLGSTHFGSHLGELQIFLDGVSPFEIGALDWLALQGVNLISQWVGGASASNAVIDQVPPPMGTTLGEIGRTDIPSHAITFKVPTGELKDSIYDPDESYYDMYWYTTTLMYQIRDVREEYLNHKLALLDEGLGAGTTLDGGDPAQLYPLYNNYMLFKGMIEDGIQKAGKVTSVLDGTFELPSKVDIYKYALGETEMGGIVDPLLDVFVAGADPVGVALDYFLPEVHFPTVQSILEDQLKVNEASMEALRSLIFNNDDNDGVVRVQSQSGELEKECQKCVTNIDHVLHGFAPRYPVVQDKLVELLKSDMTLYNEHGFPPVDHPQKLYDPSKSLDLFKVPINGISAICQSGMPPAHARALAHVADEDNVIFITRPVNPDATELIAQNAATKAMNVKPKSSNWGPQKGYLPVKQRYSKLWKVFTGEERNKKIMKYDSLGQHDLTEGICVARELTIPICNDMYKVYIDEKKYEGHGDGNAEDEVVLVPLADPSLVCTWSGEFEANETIEQCTPISNENQLVPLQVMSSPGDLEDDGTTPRYLTADYDLLMVGFFEGEDQGPPSPPDVPFRPVVGQCTPEQEVLLSQLNQAVQNTGYRGGKVVHHGPENQFSQSPYIDYPLTVFAPDNIPNGLFNRSTDGLILSIEMGPPGFRDINLKQFVNKMRRAGYDLYDNPAAPGWKWTWDADAEAYQLEDSKDLSDYVEALPMSTCDKFGSQLRPTCPVSPDPDDASNDKPGTVPNGNLVGPHETRFTITPTIVYDEEVTMTIDMQHPMSFSWMIVDPLGHVHESGHVDGNQKLMVIRVDVSNLMTGLYTIVTDRNGPVGRLMKM